MSTRTPSEIARALRQTAAILRRPGTADAEAQKEPVFRHGRAELLDEAAQLEAWETARHQPETPKRGRRKATSAHER